MSERTVLGRTEIAELLEVDARTPHAWHARGLLPPPDYDKVNGSPAWNRAAILEWAQTTGRLPDSLCVEAAVLGLGANAPLRGGRQAKAAMREQS